MHRQHPPFAIRTHHIAHRVEHPTQIDWLSPEYAQQRQNPIKSPVRCDWPAKARAWAPAVRHLLGDEGGRRRALSKALMAMAEIGTTALHGAAPRHPGAARSRAAGAGVCCRSRCLAGSAATCRQRGACRASDRDRARQRAGGAGRRRRRCRQPAAHSRYGGWPMIPVPTRGACVAGDRHTDMRCGFPRRAQGAGGAEARPAERASLCFSRAPGHLA
jgi:hypothetical protein